MAYVVASVHGMPTDDYSFPYVAGWAGDAADKAIRETQARVNRASRTIIGVVARRTRGRQQAARHRPGCGHAASTRSRTCGHESPDRSPEAAASLVEPVPTSTYAGPEMS